MNEWTHPIHARGIKGPKVFDTIVLGPLTDRKIDEYSRHGIYSNRRYYRKELAKLRIEREVFKEKPKRMVYDLQTQEFREI